VLLGDFPAAGFAPEIGPGVFIQIDVSALIRTKQFLVFVLIPWGVVDIAGPGFTGGSGETEDAILVQTVSAVEEIIMNSLGPVESLYLDILL
jgi:hypothetical protein